MIRVVQYRPDFVEYRSEPERATVATFEQACELPFLAPFKVARDFERFSREEGETANGGLAAGLLLAHFADGTTSVAAYLFEAEKRSMTPERIAEIRMWVVQIGQVSTYPDCSGWDQCHQDAQAVAEELLAEVERLRGLASQIACMSGSKNHDHELCHDIAKAAGA